MSRRLLRSTTVSLAVAGITVAPTASVAVSAAPVYVRPGAPGEPTQRISLEEVVDSPVFSYTEADVMFMQHMIPHHGQALTMSEWALGGRAESEKVLTLARRINLVQSTEIDRMQDWLERRGEEVPEAQGPHDVHHDMPGMLTHAELEELESLSGHAFDVRFLELMIPHHQGAITMVEQLQASPGGGLEPNISVLASAIEADQRAEIGRMQLLLGQLQGD